MGPAQQSLLTQQETIVKLRENVSDLESVVQSLRQELLIKEKQLSQIEHERYATEKHVKDSKSLAEKRAEKLEEQINLM